MDPGDSLHILVVEDDPDTRLPQGDVVMTTADA